MNKTYDLAFYKYHCKVILYDKSEINRIINNSDPHTTIDVTLDEPPSKRGRATFYWTIHDTNVISPIIPTITKAKIYEKNNGIRAGHNKIFWNYCEISQSVFDNF